METAKSWNLNQKIFLSSIRFKQGDALRGIQFGLSNGVESPLYETPEGNQLPLQDADVDISKPIRKIAVHVPSEGSKLYFWGLKFLSDTGETTLCLDWFEFASKPLWREYVVGEGLNVIGYYGDMD